MTIDANDLERMAKERPNECFLKGSGVLKLTDAIRQLERDSKRLNWLETMTVNVRVPLLHGSQNLFWATPENDDPTYPAGLSDIRAQIDAAIQSQKKETGNAEHN